MKKENFEYKFILLSNNDFIFSKIDIDKSTNTFMRLIKPLRVLISEDSESVNYNFVPWIPFTTDEIIPLSTKSIVTITSLSSEYIELYEKAHQNIENSREEHALDLMNEISFLN